MPQLYGRVTSSNVRKILWALDEIGLDYELVPTGAGFAPTDTPAYRALNPNGLVPCWVDGDFVLWESHAILRHLGRCHGLWPAMPAHADQWMEWTSSVLAQDMRLIYLGLARTPPERRDASAIAAAQSRVEGAWAILDGWLATHAHLGGADFSVADIPAGILARRWQVLAGGMAAWPAVSRWLDSLAARPRARWLDDPA